MAVQMLEGGSIDMPGDEAKPCFLLLHGFGTTPMDLFRLAEALARHGYSCRLVALLGHSDPTGDLGGVEPADWHAQVLDEFDQLSAEHDQVFVVGFSLGAILGLHLATKRAVAGVVAISIFVRPRYPRLTVALLGLATRLPIRRWPRWLQTTTRATKRSLPHLTSLSPITSIKVVDLGSSTWELLNDVSCPVVLFHSIDDRLADYRAAARLTRLGKSFSMITFTSLNHFLQFDMSPELLCKTIRAYLGLIDSQGSENLEAIAGKAEQRNEDARHWSDIVFRLILAFFTIFGALLFFSLEDVFNESERASTFLLSYVFVLSLYVQLAALYFFYVVRVDVYLKSFAEPLNSGLGWTGFRTNRFVSGAPSATMTRLISASVVGMPLVGAAVLLVYAVVKYWTEDFGPTADNNFHQIFGAVSLLMWLWALRASVSLNSYTTRSLYHRVPLRLPSETVTRAIDELYQSVDPGMVDPTPPTGVAVLGGAWQPRPRRRGLRQA
jgi:carboxylesterase